MKLLHFFVAFAALSPFCEASAKPFKDCFSSSHEQSIAREKPMITLYYLPWCPYCIKVTDYLRQIHRTVPMKGVQDPAVKEELRKIGGKSQVPCLVINGKAMYESATITQWLSKNKSLLESQY